MQKIEFDKNGYLKPYK